MYIMKTFEFDPINHPGTVITGAFTEDGHYIGNEDQAKYLYGLGIKPELKKPDSKICSIGFCQKDQKWYGWSHRAIYGFGIGSKVSFGDNAYKSRNADEYLKQCVNFWRDPEFQSFIAGAHSIENGVSGVLIKYRYNNKVPNKDLHGEICSQFMAYPEEWGNGEWTAKTLNDAKQMAIDFADGVA